MAVYFATNDDRGRWDAYLDRYSAQPSMNYYVWKEILKKSYGVDTFFIFAENSAGEICGVCPGYFAKTPGGRVFYSLRFGLIADNASVNELFTFLIPWCKAQGATAAVISSGYTRVATSIEGYSKKTVCMGLASSEEEAWRALSNKTRNMIRKAIKSGLIAEYGLQNLREFYKIYRQRMLGKGISIHSYEFFKNLTEQLADRVELIVAKSSNEVIGGILNLLNKDCAIYPFQAYRTGTEQYAPTQFLIWETMKLCIKNGISILDMGESREGSGVYQSKVNFGGIPRELYYYTPLRQNIKEKSFCLAKIFDAVAAVGIARGPLFLRRKVGVWRKKQGRII